MKPLNFFIANSCCCNYTVALKQAMEADLSVKICKIAHCNIFSPVNFSSLKMIKFSLVGIISCLFFQVSIAQNWPDTARMIDHLFDQYHADRPGCQLSISKNGKLVYSKAWGMANLETNSPYTTQTVTEAGSISKQFTAATILLLEQQGKLSLEDDVRKYLPELPKYGAVIRLKHLLHHTSGIREWSMLSAVAGWPRTTKAYRNEDVLQIICRQEKLNNVPGSEFIYSNSNYVLLAIVAERVSGMSLSSFTHKYIFEPAAMTHTSWRDSYKKVVSGRGIAYAKTGDTYEINMPNESVYGPGSLLTTTEDLVKWNEFYLNGKLGKPGLLGKQLATEKLPGKAETDYAAGLYIDQLRGHQLIYHDGQTAGYVGILESFPDLNLSIAWLSNTTEFKATLFDEVTAIENLLVKAAKPEEHVKATALPVPIINGEKLKTYLGWYIHGKTDQGMKITTRHDTLLFDNTLLLPITDNEFKYKASKIKFTSRNTFILTTPDKREITFTKADEIEITPDYLKKFTGTYYSKETESSFVLTMKKGALMLEQGYLKDVTFLPTYKNAFNFYLTLDSNLNPQLLNILFKQNSKKKETTCEISTNDARGIKFVKLP